MATEKILVHMGMDESVVVEGTTRRLGITTGAAGAPNVTHYEVVIHGIACEGWWDDDGRHLTTVSNPPEALVSALAGDLRSQRAHQRITDRRASEEAERRFYGSAIS
jgi:hypothetical protein